METTTKKEQLFSRVTIAVFLALLILPTLLWGMFGLLDHVTDADETAGILAALDYDLGENRNKAPYPDEFDPATYPALLEAYYNDRVPFRALIISCNRKITGTTEDFYKENIRPTLISLLYGDTMQDPSAGNVMVENDLEHLFGDKDHPAEGNPDFVPGTEPSTAESNTDHSDKTEDTPAPVTHQYQVTAQADATCLTDGFMTYTCTKCGDTYCKTLPATGHDYRTTAVVEPDYDNFGYSLYTCARCATEMKTDYTQKLIDTSYFPPNIINENAIEGRRNWLFYPGNNSVAYYRGLLPVDAETMTDYCNRVATLQSLCEEKGIQLQMLIVPNKEQVYAEYMPSYTIKDPYKRVPRLIDTIRENTGVDILYPLEELQSGKLYWQTYYKYDTHWTYAGAFIGIQCLYRALDLPTTNLKEFEYNLTYREGGDLVLLSSQNPADYTGDPVYNPLYKTTINILNTTGERDGEGTFTARSDSENQCNFVLIGDSFRLQMLPFLERDFSNVTLTHRCNIASSQIVTAVKEADILVLQAAERYDTRLMDDVNKLIDILSDTEE